MKLVSRVVWDEADFVGFVAEVALGLFEGREFTGPPALGIGAGIAEQHEVNNRLLDSGGEKEDRGIKCIFGEDAGGRGVE